MLHYFTALPQDFRIRLQPRFHPIQHGFIDPACDLSIEVGGTATLELADCGEVLIEDQVSSPGRVVQRKRDTMLAKKNVLEREGQSVTHDEPRPLNDCVYTVRFPGDKTGPRQTPDDVVRHDGLQQVPIAVAQSGKELLGNFGLFYLGSHI
jgi:hypothetical protein